MLALPFFPVALQGRSTEGLLWDPAQGRVVVEVLPAITRPSQLHEEVELDSRALASAVQSQGAKSAALEPTAIFGGYLLRHFGHFMHESLSRLWWLGQGETSDSLGRRGAVRSRLQTQKGDVVFFMPHWLDGGKHLSAYMAEVLTGLGLSIERIRILVDTTQVRHLLIPAPCWSFNIDRPVWNEHLGCNCRQLMRGLLGSYALPPTPGEDGTPPSDKLYITRSGLPLKLGHLLGDVFLDRLMEAAGFRIFQPERHPIAEQIRHDSQASELVFMDGSALYLLWSCRLRPGVRTHPYAPAAASGGLDVRSAEAAATGNRRPAMARR